MSTRGVLDGHAPSAGVTEASGPSRSRGLTFTAPRLTDPRLHVAAALLSVQVLGQVALDFQLSIAQILVSLATVAVIEILLTAPRTRVVAWPASALLTGNGVALLLRVPGTGHGDWWSLRGWYVFALTAAVAVLSKHVVRWDDRPLFNPSNLGLVLTFVVLGSGIADPQDLWWGPMSVGLVLTYLVVGVAGVLITRRLGLLAVSAVFWVVFAALMAVVSLAGHSMTARWSLGPVEGMQYWTTLALSPEILIFLFFMITDPRTIARGRAGGVLFGAAVAVTSGVLVAFQTTEFATKVALLCGLVAVCAVRPFIERVASPDTAGEPARWLRARHTRAAALSLAGVGAVALVLVGAVTSEPLLPDQPGASGSPGSRPGLSADQRPDVDIGDGLAEVAGSFDRAEVERVVRDVIGALLVADRAVAEGDAGLAAEVATGPFLDGLAERPVAPAPDRTVVSALVDVVRDPDDFQARPRLEVTLEGTVDGERWTATYHVLATSADARIEREVAPG